MSQYSNIPFVSLSPCPQIVFQDRMSFQARSAFHFQDDFNTKRENKSVPEMLSLFLFLLTYNVVIGYEMIFIVTDWLFGLHI